MFIETTVYDTPEQQLIIREGSTYQGQRDYNPQDPEAPDAAVLAHVDVECDTNPDGIRRAHAVLQSFAGRLNGPNAEAMVGQDEGLKEIYRDPDSKSSRRSAKVTVNPVASRRHLEVARRAVDATLQAISRQMAEEQET